MGGRSTQINKSRFLCAPLWPRWLFLMSRSCSALQRGAGGCCKAAVCDCLKDNLFNSRSNCGEDGKSERAIYSDGGVGVGAEQQCGNSGPLCLLSQPAWWPSNFPARWFCFFWMACLIIYQKGREEVRQINMWPTSVLFSTLKAVPFTRYTENNKCIVLG